MQHPAYGTGWHSAGAARRSGGGGAVFHDLGNTCFTFMAGKPGYDKSVSTNIILQALRQLADFVIARHWPQLQDQADRYLLWFTDVVERTAHLIAHWQTVGFAHGVMNTDNMSILGITIDYGPYGFLDDYQPGYICNHSDHQGRYAFDNQPAVALWNLHRLAQTLSGLMTAEQLQQALAAYEPALMRSYGEQMRAKLGFFTPTAQDNDVLTGLLSLMAQEGRDYTRTFRLLSETEQQQA